jgi:hypothetical protein
VKPVAFKLWVSSVQLAPPHHVVRRADGVEDDVEAGAGARGVDGQASVVVSIISLADSRVKTPTNFELFDLVPARHFL